MVLPRGRPPPFVVAANGSEDIDENAAKPRNRRFGRIRPFRRADPGRPALVERRRRGRPEALPAAIFCPVIPPSWPAAARAKRCCCGASSRRRRYRAFRRRARSQQRPRPARRSVAEPVRRASQSQDDAKAERLPRARRGRRVDARLRQRQPARPGAAAGFRGGRAAMTSGIRPSAWPRHAAAVRRRQRRFRPPQGGRAGRCTRAVRAGRQAGPGGAHRIPGRPARRREPHPQRRTYADQMANQLLAAIATNPLLKGERRSARSRDAVPVGRARQDADFVINLSGLQAEEAQQAFVNQLQMALFSWIRRHPSPTACSTSWTRRTTSRLRSAPRPARRAALALARQARKYGLGMIFATQAPKDIDNKIISNCTTHFYGRMSSPATLQATRELMPRRVRAARTISASSPRRILFLHRRAGRPMRIRTPLCFSFIRQNPLTAEEVAERARLTGARRTEWRERHLARRYPGAGS